MLPHNIQEKDNNFSNMDFFQPLKNILLSVLYGYHFECRDQTARSCQRKPVVLP